MAGPVVAAQGLNLTLRSGGEPLHILKDINFAVDPGEVVAVVGPSGSGKTSLLMVLGGLERASSGSVTLDGVALEKLGEDALARARRRSLGILFQNFHLIPTMTALENVALALEIANGGGPPRQARTAAAEALERVGLRDRASHRPGALSGGEQQRVGLARAIVTRPKLLLADEPTGNLDGETGSRVISLMFALARESNSSIMLITHDPALASRADRLMTMQDGRLSPAAAA